MTTLNDLRFDLNQIGKGLLEILVLVEEGRRSDAAIKLGGIIDKYYIARLDSSFRVLNIFLKEGSEDSIKKVIFEIIGE